MREHGLRLLLGSEEAAEASVIDEGPQKNAAVAAKTNLGNLFRKALEDRKR